MTNLDTNGIIQLAACKGMETRKFFLEPGHKKEVLDAKAVCRKCPIIAACRAYALDNGIVYGVWGGMSETERKLYRRKMRAAARADRNAAETA